MRAHQPCDAIRRRPRRVVLRGHRNAARRAVTLKRNLKESTMKRFHVHVAVPDLNDSIRFYSTMFGAEPSVVKPDYAKWMLDDPRLNFAISMQRAEPGLNHLGIQVESQDELHEVYDRLRAADAPMIEQGQTQCCYHRSEKAWIADPAG